jgi:phosphoglycerate kinase
VPITSIEDLPIEGRRVFIRADLNVPLTPARGVADDTRIRASLPTIKHAVERGARVIVASHLGRPKGKVDPQFSMEPVGTRLAELLGQEVILTDEPTGDGARKVVGDLHEGHVALLENLRFDPGETKNDDALARSLAGFCDVYINDAFGAAHRAHASTVGMVSHVAEKGAGLLLLRELAMLGKLLGDVERPFLAVIGGAKVSDKIGVLENLLDRVDGLIVGGAMANTFLKAQGGEVGKSLVEEEKLALARSFLRKAEQQGREVMLPRDAVCAANLDAPEGTTYPSNQVPADLMALDIGPETAQGFADRLSGAKTIFWNGPMGVFEKQPFAAGTMAIAKAVATSSAFSVVGGGDSVAALKQSGLAGAITHLSTGGGASLELLEGKALPGVAALESA